ncbi:hypothetical protein E5K02_08510 [Hymenobacter metallicola]|uniref:Uncharacterized protein n=1 Tax=Hymenobacter metallicola TaxID=2563114 RepID=A0A4Z0QHJ3_9BACT|nr:hypothetical protein E5K02_08510 [Hymenobacter metallicola]
MTKNILCPAGLWLCLFSGFGCYAQTTASPALAYAQQLYTSTLGNEAQLFNGPEYLNFIQKYHTARGHQFFASDEARPAAITYDGYTYEAIPIRYDIVNDQVVIKHATSPLLIKLIREKVNSFSLDGHTFVWVGAELPSDSEMKPGFYDQIFNDRLQLLVKRYKVVQERATTLGTEAKFSEKDKVFAKKDGAYYPITAKGDLLKLLPDRKKELQKYIAEHKLSFKAAAREASLLELAKYYHTL